jgi:uncharacterized protein (DUF433 family)
MLQRIGDGKSRPMRRMLSGALSGILRGGTQIMAASTPDWSQCSAVESIPGKRGGAWVFKDSRTPISMVFENLQDMSVDELIEEFGVTREQVQAVLQFAAQTAEAPARGH